MSVGEGILLTVGFFVFALVVSYVIIKLTVRSIDRRY